MEPKNHKEINEKYKARIEIKAGSELANLLYSLSPKEWGSLFKKAKASKMEADEIMTETNKESDTQFILARTQESLDKFLASIREVDAERKAETKK